LFPDKADKKRVDTYIQTAIELFKDDALFFKEFKRFLKNLPKTVDLTTLIYDELMTEWISLEDQMKNKETSKLLQ
jgi:hypothetical protein